VTGTLFDLADVRRSAVLSDCGTYRYELRRVWDSRPLVGWIMLNPSTADASVDDATIRKCMAYARAWGYGGIVVRNLYALRSIDPKALKQHPNPVGPDNWRHLAAAAQEPMTVCGWGNNADPLDAAYMVERFLADGLKLHALMVTKSGQPAHPLYLRADLRPQEYTEVPA
jgi:hypothetical protein